MSFDPTHIPKVELHVHLDTCLSYFYVKQILPEITLNQFNSQFIAPEKCLDLGDFLNKVEPQIALLQSKAAITLAVDDLFYQLKKDNVIYAEFRFAPLLHTRHGLSTDEIVEITLSAMKQASEKYDIAAGLILCTLRHFTAQESMETARLVIKYQKQGVVALDLAADEARYSLDAHESAFQWVKKAGGNVIAHAGEAKGAMSVSETLDKLNVSRIGHGVRSIEDPSVIERLIAENILLEVCPSCNITCHIFDRIEDHSIDRLKKAGVKLNINTDARTVANTTLNKEYQLLHRVFGWNESDFRQCNIDAIDASFISSKLKMQFIEYILSK